MCVKGATFFSSFLSSTHPTSRANHHQPKGAKEQKLSFYEKKKKKKSAPMKNCIGPSSLINGRRRLSWKERKFAGRVSEWEKRQQTFCAEFPIDGGRRGRKRRIFFVLKKKSDPLKVLSVFFFFPFLFKGVEGGWVEGEAKRWTHLSDDSVFPSKEMISFPSSTKEGGGKKVSRRDCKVKGKRKFENS